jgi:hypothetical protein
MPYGKALVVAFFAALLALGVAIHRDYGLSHDEVAQRTTGMVTVNYLADLAAGRGEASELHVYDDRDYGVAFEAPAAALELLLGLSDTRDIFMFRHLLTFLFCLAGAWALYSLALRRFADRRFALLAVAFLVLTPRLFAESFYNSKDAVFMAAYAIALNTAVAYILNPGWRTALLHGLASAFAIDVRMAAITIPVATLAVLPLRMAKREVPWRALWTLAAYVAATSAFVVVLWPWLWADPPGRFAQALDLVSRFRFDHEILYLGELVRTRQLPWHYVPVWMAITTPPLYLVLFLAGVAAVTLRFVRAGNALWRSEAELQDLMFLAFAVLPIVATMLYNPVLYDGWRQLYFIYPAFLMVALAGWHALWTLAGTRAWRTALGAVTALSFAVTAIWMWRAHPLQNVYFNPLAGRDVLTRYEVDYWGLSLRPALEHLLAHDPSDTIRVMEGNYLELQMRFAVLRPDERRRLVETLDASETHYAITNFPPHRHPEKNVAYGPDYDLFHEVKVAGEVVMRVFKSRTSRSPRG